MLDCPAGHDETGKGPFYFLAASTKSNALGLRETRRSRSRIRSRSDTDSCTGLGESASAQEGDHKENPPNCRKYCLRESVGASRRDAAGSIFPSVERDRCHTTGGTSTIRSSQLLPPPPPPIRFEARTNRSVSRLARIRLGGASFAHSYFEPTRRPGRHRRCSGLGFAQRSLGVDGPIRPQHPLKHALHALVGASRAQIDPSSTIV